MVAKNLAVAYYNLSTMLDAGVPVVRSLNTITSGLKGPLRRTFGQLTETVSKGNPISEAMALSPKIFVPLDIMIVQAAETSGNLAESLGLLSKWHEFSRRIKKKILSGLALPILLIHLTAIIAPFPSLALGGWQVSGFILSALRILSLFYIPAAIIFAIMRFTPQAGSLRRGLNHVTLKIPALGRATYKLALSRYCWVFHMLCKAGVNINDCAEMAVAGTGNAVVAELFRPAAAVAKAGNPLSEGLSSKLPREFIELWRIGEETGNLDDVTKRLANNNAEAAEFWFREFGRWLPRVVYGLVCLVMIYYIFVNLGRMRTAMSL